MNAPALSINSNNHCVPIPVIIGCHSSIGDSGSTKSAYLIDLDGVLVHGQTPIAGAVEFINRLNRGEHQYLILTNNSRFTPRDLQYRLQVMGFDIGLENIYSSAMATADYVQAQQPYGSAYALGDLGLYAALAEAGYQLTNYHPDYVVLGETDGYAHDKLRRAVQLILEGVSFIATNPDPITPLEQDRVDLACGSVAAMLERATGVSPYYVGKPNPFMLRSALQRLGEPVSHIVIVGDRLDTDIKMGLESGLETILVLSGVTRLEMLARSRYRPSRVVKSVTELELQ